VEKYKSQARHMSAFSYAPVEFNDDLLIRIPDKNKDNYKKIYSFLSKYCQAFPSKAKPNIVLIGGTGTGKTYASHIIANQLFERGLSILYLTAFQLINRFKTYIKNFNGEELDELFTVDLLVIDDLGTEPMIKNITIEYLYNVINDRMADKKPFIITTNLSPNDIAERYGDRLQSRILSQLNSSVIEMSIEDLRLGVKA
jgi:DNA replication protein DnaC